MVTKVLMAFVLGFVLGLVGQVVRMRTPLRKWFT
jgi:hypothetical protein